MVNAAIAVARGQSLAGNQENFLRVRRLPANAFFRSPAAFRDAPPARSAVSTPCAVDEPLHQPSPCRIRRGTRRVEDLQRPTTDVLDVFLGIAALIFVLVVWRLLLRK